MKNLFATNQNKNITNTEEAQNEDMEAKVEASKLIQALLAFSINRNPIACKLEAKQADDFNSNDDGPSPIC